MHPSSIHERLRALEQITKQLRREVADLKAALAAAHREQAEQRGSFGQVGGS